MPDVWMVNQYAVTPDLPGGTRHYDLGVELARRGFGVTIFASDVNLALRTHTRLGADEAYRLETNNGVRFCWLRAAEYEGNDWRRAWNLVSFARSFDAVSSQLGFPRRPDVIIGSSPSPFAALAAQRVARRLGAHFVLELRDLWPQALVDMGRLSEWHPAIQLMRWLESYLYRRAERIVVLARGSGNYLRRRGFSEHCILYLPNGVHLAHFQAALTRAESRRRYGFHRFTVVYTGAHGPANSLETILDAAEQLRDQPVEFVLVGDGPSKSSLVQTAKARGLSGVRFMAAVPKSEVPNLLLGADAALITLKNARVFAYGISPNKLFDYMAAGLPIVCAVPGEIAALVQTANAGVACDPENPDALARAVVRLLRMAPEDRFRMGARGREYLVQHHDRSRLADRLADMLLELTETGLGTADYTGGTSGVVN